MSIKILKSLWDFREFILGAVKRDFEVRYHNSLFGFFWSIVNPVFTITIYTLVFSNLMQPKLGIKGGEYSYSIYICTGILTWGLFSEIVNRGLNIFIDNSNILKKVAFPRIALPISLLLTCLANFSIIFLLFSLFLVFSGNFPGVSFLGIFPMLIILCLLGIGLGIFFGMLNIFFRDVGQFFIILMQLWFWITPIVYPLSILPDYIKGWVGWNPVTPIIMGLQSIMVDGDLPVWSSLMYPTCIALLFCLAGLRLFRRHGRDMVDEL